MAWEEEARKHGEEWMTKYIKEAVEAALSTRAAEPLGLEPPGVDRMTSRMRDSTMRNVAGSLRFG